MIYYNNFKEVISFFIICLLLFTFHSCLNFPSYLHFCYPFATVENIIDTIFPAPIVRYASSISASTKHIYIYSIPLELTGVALTCMGFGWPPPSIRWTKDSGALPTGVTSVVTTKQGRVKAKLNFDIPFGASHIGIYKCEIAKPGVQNVIEVSFQVYLYHGKLHIDLRKSTHQSSKIEGGNITPTIRRRILSTTALLSPWSRQSYTRSFCSYIHI